MPFNGSGTFTPATSPGYPAVSGTTIASAQFNNVVADVATGLTNTVTRDGQSAPTADLPMGTKKHTGVANAAARDQYASLAQVQDGAATILSGAAGTNTITATGPFSLAAYAVGQEFSFVAAGANTGATTLNINSIGAKAIRKRGTTALVTGDILAGMVCQVVYDGTYFQLLNAADTTLTRLGAATNGTNKVPYFTTTDTVAMLDFIDDDSMATATATSVPSGESVKAYVDTKALSGTYTPTLANKLNVSAIVTVYTAHYLRIGNEVSVTGRAIITPTAGGPTEVYVDLPIPSNIAADSDVIGNAYCDDYLSGAVIGYAATDKAVVKISPASGASVNIIFKFNYTVI